MSIKEAILREQDIVHENGGFWVLNTHRSYDVMKTGVTHSKGIMAFPSNADGKSNAIAYADYLATH